MNLEPIDTSTTAGKAEVMQLAVGGRKVVHRTKGDKVWWDCPNPIWMWATSDYAIIAEPVGPDELFAVIGTAGETVVVSNTLGGVECYGAKLGRTIVRYVREDLAGGAA